VIAELEPDLSIRAGRAVIEQEIEARLKALVDGVSERVLAGWPLLWHLPVAGYVSEVQQVAVDLDQIRLLFCEERTKQPVKRLVVVRGVVVAADNGSRRPGCLSRLRFRQRLPALELWQLQPSEYRLSGNLQPDLLVRCVGASPGSFPRLDIRDSPALGVKADALEQLLRAQISALLYVNRQGLSALSGWRSYLGRSAFPQQLVPQTSRRDTDLCGGRDDARLQHAGFNRVHVQALENQ